MTDNQRKRKAGGRWCGAPFCSNNSFTSPDKSFFRFPKDEARSKEWVKACKRLDLADKSADYLYTTVCVCSDHFEDCMYYNFLRNRLKETAKPTIFNFPTIPAVIAQYKALGQSQLIKKLKTSHNTVDLTEESSDDSASEDDCGESEDFIMAPVEPIILVHGGAGNYAYANIDLILDGIRAAARKGHQELQSGSSVLDATIAAVQVLESDPQFNAGITISGSKFLILLIAKVEIF